MKWISKHRYKLLALAGAIVVVGLLYGETMVRQAWFLAITPSGEFGEYEVPPAPDYGDMEMWAAHPQKADNADRSPEQAMFDNQDRAAADVFFIHPTTFIDRSGWNQPLHDETANELVDERVLPSQAGVFNTCCRVYAPRYRQATIAAFFPDHRQSGERALAVAYDDVARAFDHFVTAFNDGRPFILAGHSQGARHAQQLLTDRILGTPLEDRLVAAYTIGQALEPAGGMPVCEKPAQTGCQISWNSQTEDAEISIGQPGSICVNPLTWTTDNNPAGHAQNVGGVDFEAGGEIEPGVADAQCRNGKLLLTEVRSENFDLMPFGPGNYHLYEYALYHMNLRENAQTRVEAFLAE